MKEMLDGFFGESPEFWIGKVVSIDAQKQTAQGFSWGWRYKVRIFGTYSNSDNIQDKDCHTAMVMLGVTDGSGGGEGLEQFVSLNMTLYLVCLWLQIKTFQLLWVF